MERRTFGELATPNQRLIKIARAAVMNAYAPYSGFAVGAAVRTRTGGIYSGANLENAAYGVGMCAEVGAITAANSAGDYEITTIAVVGLKFTSPKDATRVVTPCGRCRQLIFEAGEITRADVTIFSCSGDLAEIRQSTISEMLPEAFGPANLGLREIWPTLRAELARSVQDLEAVDADVSIALER
ncbi:cytidine deaminase [Rhodopseudomonas sp. HC1]|uniref:cytidine deaminase n=1 Tax=Rhodopseudomonas infernalis TaxID=2897386 RepID=UPI001EE7AD45|nr:cytidine deaminase [Rhodopseudomonas infernalis]MCG6205752.1 cytidine deaminase [Rhodopseudomonas infernalis]